MNPVIMSLVGHHEAHIDLQESIVRRQLDPKFLYHGAHMGTIYEAIMNDPAVCPKYRKKGEYGHYLYSYLREHIPELKQHIPLAFVSLGIGTGDIERAFLEEHVDQHLYSHVFVDFSLYFLEQTTLDLTNNYPSASFYPIHADFTKSYNGQLRRCIHYVPKERRIFLLMGELLSKYHPTTFLNQIMALMSKGDYLVCDLDIFPSDAAQWLSMVKNQILKFSHQEYYFERITALGFDRESTSLEFQLRDEAYNNFWNVYTRVLTFTAPQPIEIAHHFTTLYPEDKFGIASYHYFKEKNLQSFFNKFPGKLLNSTAPLIKQPQHPLRWCIFQKTS